MCDLKNLAVLSLWLMFANVLILVFMTNCSNPNGQEKQSIQQVTLDDFTSIETSSISIQRYVPLETINENLLGMDLRIKFSDNHILIMDESTKDRIHIFDSEGMYLSSIAKVGEGPNTLPSLDDFEFGKKGEILVLSTMADKATIYSTSISGELSKKFELDYIATSFAYLENGDYLFYGGYNLPFVTHRVIQTNAEGVVHTRYLENDYKNKMLPMTERNFYPSDSGIFILESFNSEIYLHEGKNLSPVLKADFGVYELPSQFWEMDIMDGFEMINANGFANFRSVFRSKNLLITDVMIQKEAEVFKYILFEKAGNRYKLKADRNKELLYYFPIGIDQEERVLFVTYKSILEKHFGESLRKLPMDNLPTGDYDYPVIIHVALNNSQ